MHDLRFVPRTLLAILACTLALGLAACSSDDSSDASSPGTTERIGNGPTAAEEAEFDDLELYVADDGPVQTVVGGKFGLAVPRRPDGDVRWSPVPNADFNYLILLGAQPEADVAGLDGGEEAMVFRYRARGEGTTQVTLAEVTGDLVPEPIPGGEMITFTVNIAPDPEMVDTPTDTTG